MAVPMIRVSFSGPPGEPPMLIDLTMDDFATAGLDALLHWSFDNDGSQPRDTVDVPKLDRIAPVQVYRAAIQCDDRTCVICCEDFRPRKHVRQLPCGHMFCSKCISKWVVKQSATCPTCRCALSG